MLLIKEDPEQRINNLKKEIASRFSRIFRGISLKKLADKSFILNLIEGRGLLLKDNASYAFRIFKEFGFLDPKKFSLETAEQFWYFVYFSDFSAFSNFQKRYLLELQKNLKNFPVLRPYFAFLDDKINFLSNLPQKYGTFILSDKLENIDKDNLDVRRKSMGISWMEDYSQSRKPVYLILGIPASGKDTQAEILSKKLNIPRIDAGSTFTNIIRNKEKHWEAISDAFAEKLPIPSDVFIEIMSDKFRDPELSDGFVLTQQSKSVDEANEMISVLQSLGFEIKNVFFLNTDRNEAIERSVKRLNGKFTEKEPTIEAVIKRIDNYCKLIVPVTELYKSKGLLIEINGSEPVDVISSKIFANIK